MNSFNYPPIVIFEGPDQCGKTTLAEMFMEHRPGYQYFRSTKQMGSNVDLEAAIKYDWRFMLDFLSQVGIGSGVIFDRAFVSQFVYSITYRLDNVAKHYAPKEYTDLFEDYVNKLSELNHYVVFCYRKSYEGLIDKHNAEVNEEKMKRVSHNFANFFGTTGVKLNVIWVPFENGIEKNLKILLEEIQ